MTAPKQFLILCMALLAFGTLHGQSSLIRRADQLYDLMAYPAAIRAYERGMKAGETRQAMERLADCYRLIGNTQKAEMWYGKAAMLSDATPSSKFRFGQMLMANGKYAEARRAFEDYQRTGDNVAKATRYAMACGRVAEFKADSARYKLELLKVNTHASDFGAVSWDKGIIFASSKARGFFTHSHNTRNENHFYDLYYADNALPGQEKVRMRHLKGKVNSRHHDGPAFVTREGIMYFTRSNEERDTKGVTHLHIYSAKWNGKKWVEVKALPFNDDHYTCAHPTLSADGNTMIFSSDMPGGSGGTDLYMVQKSGETWGKPVNLGSGINTEGMEKFPFLHSSGTLFFSSDGHAGLGGLDVFSAEPAGAGQFKDPRNAGFPLNSSRDDFSISWIGSQANGYVASNRPGGRGEDDIWSFSRKSAIQGTVVDARTQRPLPGITVTVMDANSRTSTYVTNAEGRFTHIADFNRDYFLTVEAPGYLPRKEIAATKDMSPVADLEKVIALEPEQRFALSGLVVDDSTSTPLAGATVRLVGIKGERTVQTDAQGRYKADLDPDESYFVIVQKEGHVPYIAQLGTAGVEPQEFVQNARLRRGHYILVNGLVTNQTTLERLGGATIRGIDARKRVETAFFRTGADGRFFMVLDPAIPQFLLVGSRKDFFSRRVDIPTPVASRDTALVADMPLVPYRVGEVVKIIYYDYRKSDIREDASWELFDIIYFLADNPEAAVELSSHTDSRGSGEFNRKLSQDRADAAVKFITQHGIGQERIVARGMGESKPVNTCSDGTQCDESEHALNRRTEITVVSLSGSTGVKEAPKTGEESKN